MKKIVIVLLILLIISLVGYFTYKPVFGLFIPEKAHYHAGFYVYENGKKKDFSDVRYMHIKPCTDETGSGINFEEIQIDKGHLHDGIGDIDHLHRKGGKWRDLFTNMKYPIDYSKARGYINGKKVENFQDQPVVAYDSLIVFIGKNNEEELLQKQIPKSYIVEREKKSQDCGV